MALTEPMGPTDWMASTEPMDNQAVPVRMELRVTMAPMAGMAPRAGMARPAASGEMAATAAKGKRAPQGGASLGLTRSSIMEQFPVRQAGRAALVETGARAASAEAVAQAASAGSGDKVALGVSVAQEVLATQAAREVMEGLAVLEEWAEPAASGHWVPQAATEAMEGSAARVAPGFLLQPHSRFSTLAQSVAALAVWQALVGLVEPLVQTAPMGPAAMEAQADLLARPAMAAMAELVML